MAKKANEFGRIEGESKVSKFKQIKWGAIGKTALVVGLVLLGVAGTLQYQKFINDTKTQGVAEYIARECDKYTDKDKKTTWLECEVTKEQQ